MKNPLLRRDFFIVLPISRILFPSALRRQDDNHLSSSELALGVKRLSPTSRRSTVLHRSKDLAVALSRRREIHLVLSIARSNEMLLPFGSSVTVRTSHVAVYRRYLLPFCFLL